MKLLNRSPRFLVMAFFVAVMFIMAQPVLAAAGGTLGATSLNAAGCYVDVSAVVQDAGFYAINMWDDGNFRAGAGSFVPEGGTLIVRFNIGGVILQGAAGIGVYLEDAVGAAAAATYDSDGSAQLWSDTVGTDCQTGGSTWGASVVFAGGGGDACINPLPEGTPIYSVPNGAPAYYAADPGTYTGFDLPAGTWYITEFTNGYAKVWITCASNQVYIPIASVVR